MTRSMIAWTLTLALVCAVGAVLGSTYLMVLPLVLPLIWADQYVTTHYRDEDTP
jgi:hypothetical protein